MMKVRQENTLNTGYEKMGYTHYWSPSVALHDAGRAEAFKNCAKVIAAAGRDIAFESDEPKKRPVCDVDSGLIRFNGIGEDGHETFYFQYGGPWSFCKTNNKHYDIYVTACLLVLNHFGLADISSDGDCYDWESGTICAKEVTGLNIVVPESIRSRDY